MILHVTATGNINPSRIVKMSGELKVALAGANEAGIGVAQAGTHDAPGVTGATAFAAASGQQLAVYTGGEECLVEAGAAITAGDWLESDASGRAVTATVAATLRKIVGFALQAAGGAGELIRMQVQPFQATLA